MFQEHYSHFLGAHPNLLHFAAHSHHFWPDVSRAAQIQCWDDAARFADEKWAYIFDQILPRAQTHVARSIGVSEDRQICFAPNTHELLLRLISCLSPERPINVLTTDSEFHSCSRQLARLEERSNFSVQRVSSQPFETFSARFSDAAASTDFDMIYLSHVFYNSGYVVQDLPGIVSAVKSSDTIIAIDGYHAVGAVPVDISAIQDRVFYLGGGYKYLQAGEGACFMSVPRKCSLRPESTGWFATFSNLKTIPASGEHSVAYSDDAFRFWGATFDPCGLYRFNAVQELLKRLDLTPQKAHHYVQGLQSYFLEQMDKANHKYINRQNLLNSQLETQGHFLTFRFPEASEFFIELRRLDILTDVRDDRLRFGFGLYQVKDSIDELFSRLGN